MERDAALAEAMRRVGGMRALGRALKVSGQAVQKWTRAPVGHVLAIERISGISRFELRPDVYPPDEGRLTSRPRS
jgi:DNA-binding transcriptional regulator YdaS (Cro superfamily)